MSKNERNFNPRFGEKLFGLVFIISDFSQKDLNNLKDFVLPDFLLLRNQERLMSILSKVFPLLIDIYGQERRKVNNGLYLRHVLKTGFLAARLYDQYQESFLKGVDFDRFFVSALLHDAFEMNPQDKESLFFQLKKIFSDKDDSWIHQVIEDVEFLTPPQKDSELSYLERKNQDFERFVPKKEDGNDEPFENWSVDERIRFFIKTADVWANLYESINDLKKGLDHGQMKRSLTERYQVFSYRVGRILEVLGEQSLPELASLERDFLGFIPNFKKIVDFFRDNNLLDFKEEIKYVLEKNRIIFYNGSGEHSSLSRKREQVKGGVIKIENRKGRVFIHFVRQASSCQPDENGRDFFSMISSPQKIAFYLSDNIISFSSE